MPNKYFFIQTPFFYKPILSPNFIKTISVHPQIATKKSYINIFDNPYNTPYHKCTQKETNVKTNAFYQISKTPGVPKLTLLDDKAEVITKLYYAAYNGAELEEIAPATVFFRNTLGGMVCSTAFHQEVPNAQNNEPRKEWYIEILDKLNGSKLPAVCQDLQDITALTRITAENELLLMVCNLNFDELESLKVRCAQTPSKVLRLTCDGVWEECSFSGEGEVIHIDRPMGCYDLEVFKLS